MKKLIASVLIAVQAVASFGDAKPAKAAVSLVDARVRIADVIEGKASMRELFAGLSAEDQKAFLADVNKAVNDMPASVEEKAAKSLNINRDALLSAKKGNTKALLAEMFATASPEALTVINERFAADLLNRAANPSATYTDEQYEKIALDIMAAVNERTEETDNGSVRNTFAILMLVRASNGTPADLADKLIATLKHEDARSAAKNEWIPSALGQDGRELGYEPMLASADAGRRPDFDFVLVIAGPQYPSSILGDIFGKNMDKMSFIRTRSPILDAVENPLRWQIPRMGEDVFGGDAPIVPGGVTPHDVPVTPPVPEPRPYAGQF